MENTFVETAGADFLTDEFTDIRFCLYRASHHISCFVANIPSESVLEKLWGPITSVIASEYQSGLDTLEIWNIYLVFLVEDPVSKGLQYKIENNKFSMRKLVAARLTTQAEIIGYLNNEILGADLPEKANVDSNAPVEPEVGNHLRNAIMRMALQKKLTGDDFTPHDLIALSKQVNK